MENGITLKLGKGRARRGALAQQGEPGWGSQSEGESGAAVPAARKALSRGRPGAERERSKRHLGRAGPGAPRPLRAHPPGCPARRAAPFPRDRRADVPAAAFSFRCRWPRRSRLSESLPNDPPGDRRQSSRCRGRDGAGGSAPAPLPAPHGPAPGPRRGENTNPTRQSLPGKLLPLPICKREKSPSFPTCPSQMGHFQPDLKPGQAGALLFRERLAGAAQPARCQGL